MDVNTINGWVKVKNNSFAKKVGEKTFEVIRLENNIGDNIHYDYYCDVNLNEVTSKEEFTSFGDEKNYNLFLKTETDEEKAILYAFFGLNANEYGTCQSEEEIEEMLVDVGVIPKGEKFELEY